MLSKNSAVSAADHRSKPILPLEAEKEVLDTLSANMRISSEEIAAILKKYGVSGDVDALQDSYRKRLGQLIGAPTKPPFGFVGRGGARERTQFSPQAETELSGLCDDSSSIRDETGKREVLAHGSEYVVVQCCNDQQALKAIRRRIQGQMSGLDVSAAKVQGRVHVLDQLIHRFRKAG